MKSPGLDKLIKRENTGTTQIAECFLACPDCNGTGKTFMFESGGQGSSIASTKSASCPRCRGRGSYSVRY